MSASILSSISIWPLALISAAIYVVYSTALSLYNVFYGPLSKIPGPKLRAFSKLPSIVTLVTGTEADTYPGLHTTYGPVVRIGPREVSYAGGAEHWKAVYGFKSPMYRDREFFDFSLNKVDSLFESNDEVHARQRRVLSHSFADKTLREVEERLKGWVGKMLERFEQTARAPVDMVGLYVPFSSVEPDGTRRATTH
jgi:hypothetical protein